MSNNRRSEARHAIPDTSGIAGGRAPESPAPRPPLRSSGPGARAGKISASGRPQKWLAEKIREGQRKAGQGLCHRCGAPTLKGLDNDVAAFTVVVDPDPVGPGAELRALVAGCSSYDLVRGDLYHRDRWQLLGRRRYPVVIDHVCDGGER